MALKLIEQRRSAATVPEDDKLAFPDRRPCARLMNTVVEAYQLIGIQVELMR